MPVLVTGAERALGLAAVAALAAGGGQVRAYVDPLRAPAPVIATLRAAGCKVARGASDDEGRLELALAQVHTLVIAGLEPLASPSAALDAAATAVTAAIGAGCQRIVAVLPLGGHPVGERHSGSNPYLDVLAQTEELLDEAPLETVALRCALPYGLDDPLVLALAGGVATTYRELAAVRHAPVLVDDVALAIAAADRERGPRDDLSLALRLVGPRELALADFGRLLGAPGGRVRASLGWLRGDVPVLPDHVVDALARGQPEGPATVAPTAPEEGVARLRAKAGQAWGDRT